MKGTETGEIVVEVERSGRWWAIHIPSIGGLFSQTRRLDQVEAMATEAIALLLDIDEAGIGPLEVRISPPAEVRDLLAELEERGEATRLARTEEAALRRRVAERLIASGLSTRDAGALMGVSHQRVSQILAG
jgi:predicted RNase H-like HicB family nuclease